MRSVTGENRCAISSARSWVVRKPVGSLSRALRQAASPSCAINRAGFVEADSISRTWSSTRSIKRKYRTRCGFRIASPATKSAMVFPSTVIRLACLTFSQSRKSPHCAWYTSAEDRRKCCLASHASKAMRGSRRQSSRSCDHGRLAVDGAARDHAAVIRLADDALQRQPRRLDLVERTEQFAERAGVEQRAGAFARGQFNEAVAQHRRGTGGGDVFMRRLPVPPLRWLPRAAAPRRRVSRRSR